MVHRVMALLAVVGYVVGQLAATPHSHAHGSAPEGHDVRPHIHLSGFGSGHHGHDDDGCHALDDQLAARNGDGGHDDDAVYLQVVVAGVLHAGPAQADLLECSTLHSWLPPATASNSPAVARLLAWHEPRPNSTGDHCALFLTLQSLRI